MLPACVRVYASCLVSLLTWLLAPSIPHLHTCLLAYVVTYIHTCLLVCFQTYGTYLLPNLPNCLLPNLQYLLTHPKQNSFAASLVHSLLGNATSGSRSCARIKGEEPLIPVGLCTMNLPEKVTAACIQKHGSKWGYLRDLKMFVRFRIIWVHFGDPVILIHKKEPRAKSFEFYSYTPIQLLNHSMVSGHPSL